MAEETTRYRLEDGRLLHCQDAVRELPDKRRVCPGTLDGVAVYAKFYLDPKRGRIHWQRELDGIQCFRDAGILTAELLYAGATAEQGWPVIVLAEIPRALSLKQAWAQADAHGKERLLDAMVALLARHHQAGLCQTDLHLDNFVLSQDQIYSLDGAGVEALGRALGPDMSFENLALFAAQLGPEADQRVPELYARYLAARGWQRVLSEKDLLRRLCRQRARRWNEFRGKLLRECTAFACRRTADRLQVVARPYASPALEAVLADPDASFPGREQALKNGETSTVWSAAVDGRALAIKRYNVKGLWHGLRLSARESRALASWENAHRLLFHGIATPRPVALLKLKRGPLRPIAYFIAEAVAGTAAHLWFADATVSGQARAAMATRLARLLRQLQDQRISHGDLKASNFLIRDDEVLLIDLDAMQQHRSATAFRKAWRRDLERFMRNWEDAPELRALFARALERAGVE